MMKFTTQRTPQGLRFESPEGYVEIRMQDEQRGLLTLATYNATAAEVFGATVWQLLHEIMPETGLKVLSVEMEPDAFVERMLFSAGFQKDGERRKWLATPRGLFDLACYSILDSEVRFQAAEPLAETQHGELLRSE